MMDLLEEKSRGERDPYLKVDEDTIITDESNNHWKDML